MADKYKIMSDATMGIFDQHELDITGLSNGVDEYMKATCLELLEYMAENNVECERAYEEKEGIIRYGFLFKGKWISKEELFEIFL